MFPLDAVKFSDIFANGQVWIYLGMALSFAVVLFFSSYKFLLVLQQSGYRGGRYFKWLKNPKTPYLSRLMLLCLLAFLFFTVLTICFKPILGNTVASYVGFLSFFLFIGIYINTENSVNAKIPLRKTKRLVRLCIVYSMVLFGFSFGFITLFNLIAFSIGNEIVAVLRYSLICALPILTPFILWLAYCLIEPIEALIRRHYALWATAKIASVDVIKIGITGSFGKTTVKEILRVILSQKYRVLATPESYNTPMGVALTVKKLDPTHDVLITEMGARYKGDIKELANIVKPSYGVITGINTQHLETFGSIETIKDTKYELIKALPKDGTAFFSADSEGSVELANRFNGKKHVAGLSVGEGYCYASDVVTEKTGTSFTINFNDGTSVQCKTVLLGKHSISNICLASAVAYELGMTPDEIALGINRISSVGHRLELLPNNKNVVVIDDSYNSNVNGVEAAMEVLDMFEGRKIVVTPGLVELGKEENLANLQMGKILASHADIVIITGKQNAEMIINGLVDGGMAKENIIFAKSLNKGNEELNNIIEEGDVVLFENDLPDNYN